MVAIHQDGPQSHMRKPETAGLAGDKNLYYGLELFQQGYVVLCPDRVGHAERRRGVEPGSIDPQRDLDLLNHRVGQLPLRDRTLFGKEAYDCKVAADVLTSLEHLDFTKLGGIGHSAGGETLIFWIYLDPRVRVGISSCGYFDLLRFFVSMPPNDGWRRLLCRG
jgi:cephalosporin-C deacetylase-like acetyl esterase